MSKPRVIDVVVVGSGPAGISAALHLFSKNSEWGRRVVVIEKSVHPREKLCGGGVTHIAQNILARLGLPFDVPNFEIREARLTYCKSSFSFFGNPVFRIVRRDVFDHWLVKSAETLGIEVRQGEAVRQITQKADHIEVVTENETFRAQVVVGADGANSFVRNQLNWDDEQRLARLLEVLTPEHAHTEPAFRDKTAFFDFSHITSDGLQGYYWDFPSVIGKKPFMNRGVFDSRVRHKARKVIIKDVLRSALEKRNRNLDGLQLKGFPIRRWSKNARFSIPRVVLVGDAAGSDPLMGEGISFALGYGEVAADAICDAFARKDFTFSSYRERLLHHGLFKHLESRSKLARIIYLLRWPWLFKLIWRFVPKLVRGSEWEDPDHDPGESPTYSLLQRAKVTAGSEH